uniref:Uncharacterized protein n=1 Tax=Magallana gigas TaxID=29159 RepID=A0A8W8L419_MAGGI
MERLIKYCKATTKEIESSFVLNFARTELQKFNSRVDRAYADALNLDRMTQESFTKMIPKDMNNNTPSCSGRESGDPVDGLKSQGRIWVEKFKGETDGRLGVRKSTNTFRAPVPNCARSTAIEVLDNERDGRHRVRKSTKTFRAPDPNSTRSTAIEGSWIGDNGSRRVIRKSTKTFRAPDPKSTRSSLVEYLIKCGTKHKTRANIT